ncbi:alginate lyase family protein [Devosia psychrophila]|uniref:Alginate lyase n=1 Tax=Devosia psychrophila TaxID=728005 RepID=A0A0F5Q1J4_9HYPH|nr:alginate lyase family protein [Devosia psychrophila]KKC33949.1 alginate lyase [Devosia psychrophila]SFD17976.1 poly(beta-D-mannuronate) lyase [Devosia psychrophila]
MNLGRSTLAAIALASACSAVNAAEARLGGLFDVNERMSQLQAPEFASIKEACLAVAADPAWLNLPVIDALAATEGYGTDRAANDFNWAVMVLGGRALAGDDAATDMLGQLLLTWSAANAFEATQEVQDAYYALKRVMLPVAVSYSIIRPQLDVEDNKQLVDWIDPLVRRVDHLFAGEVDLNNHRDLADSALMVWGAVIGDAQLVAKGMDRYLATLAEARPDGSVPLETRRGSRALWYTRQLLSSLTVMAEVAKGQGNGLYAEKVDQVTIWTMMGFLLNGIHNPVLVNAYAGQNYIPGPSIDFRSQDYGFLQARGNGRHYLAFMEALAAQPPAGLGQQRTAEALQRLGIDERPLIDEFAGGNATCFWGQPE